MAANNGDFPSQIDYDLHGIVGIRLLDATPGDAAVVTRQLGPIRASLTREPDIIIRFVDQLLTSSRVRYLGLDEAGFTDDAFLVLGSKHRSRTKVQIPFEQIGSQCQIVCERGLSAVPLLIPILNLTALSKGILPVHASAFSYHSIGVLTTGWAQGGKTGMLLAFMNQGAEYISDDWVYISNDGQSMYGIPEPIQLRDWYLQKLPQYRVPIGRGKRMRLGVVRLLLQSLGQVTRRTGGRKPTSTIKLLKWMMSALERRLVVHIHPQDLFGPELCVPMGNLKKIFLTITHESTAVTVQAVTPREIVQQLAFALQYEQQDFMSYYLKFRFAFPELANQLIERTEELQRELLTRALEDKAVYKVYHPYLVPIPALFNTVSPLCQ